MKNFLLSLRNRKLRNNPKVRKTVSFDRASRFGFICESIKNYQEILPKLKEITNDGGYTKVMVQKESAKSNEQQGIPSFHKDELDWLGRYSTTSLKVFEEEKFDYIFYFGNKYNTIVESLLLNTPAGCRVGFYTEEKPYLFDFMYRYHPDKSRMENIQVVFETLKKIKTDDK